MFLLELSFKQGVESDFGFDLYSRKWGTFSGQNKFGCRKENNEQGNKQELLQPRLDNCKGGYWQGGAYLVFNRSCSNEKLLVKRACSRSVLAFSLFHLGWAHQRSAFGNPFFIGTASFFFRLSRESYLLFSIPNGSLSTIVEVF